MNEEALRQLVARGEGQHLDFKVALDRQSELAKDLVCFANADGGAIVFGVTDDGELRGVQDPERLSLAIDDTAYQHCEPPITPVIETVTTSDGLRFVLLRIPKGQARPYRTKRGRYFVRSGARCREASQEELRALFQSAGSLTYDETVFTSSSIEGDLDLAAFERFVEDRTGTRATGEPELARILRGWRLASGEGGLTVAGLLLFGRDPQAHLPHARISLARIAGTEPGGEAIDQLSADGTLFDQLEDAERFLRSHLRLGRLTSDFGDEHDPELPLPALRELLTNALVHRDYIRQGPVRVLVFDDRVEVRSPGPPPNTIDASAMLSGIHVMRNPHLYTRCWQAGLVSDLGSGVPRADRAVREALGEDLIIEISEQETVVIIPRRI
jgi:ATP-dependent DNA helicase RecG